MLQKFFRNSVNLPNQLKNILNLAFYLTILVTVKFYKMILVKDYLSTHRTKLSQKITFTKFLGCFFNSNVVGGGILAVSCAIAFPELGILEGLEFV